MRLVGAIWVTELGSGDNFCTILSRTIIISLLYFFDEVNHSC